MISDTTTPRTNPTMNHIKTKSLSGGKTNHITPVQNYRSTRFSVADDIQPNGNTESKNIMNEPKKPNESCAAKLLSEEKKNLTMHKMDSLLMSSNSSVDNLVVFVGSLESDSASINESDTPTFTPPPEPGELPPLPKAVKSNPYRINIRDPISTMNLPAPASSNPLRNSSNRTRIISRTRTVNFPHSIPKKSLHLTNTKYIESTTDRKINYALQKTKTQSFTTLRSSNYPVFTKRLRRSFTASNSHQAEKKRQVQTRVLSRSFTTNNTDRRRSCILSQSQTAALLSLDGSCFSNPKSEENGKMIPKTPSLRWKLAQDKMNQRVEERRKKRLSR